MRFHFFFRTALLFFSLQLYLIDYVHQEFPIKLAGAGDRMEREFWCLEGCGKIGELVHSAGSDAVKGEPTRKV